MHGVYPLFSQFSNRSVAASTRCAGVQLQLPITTMVIKAFQLELRRALQRCYSQSFRLWGFKMGTEYVEERLLLELHCKSNNKDVEEGMEIQMEV